MQILFALAKALLLVAVQVSVMAGVVALALWSGRRRRDALPDRGRGNGEARHDG